jgi:uncharacterized DUF497 family protein
MSSSEFEWDEAKLIRNVHVHRIDFRDVPQIFDGPHLIQRSAYEAEERFIAIGFLENREVAVVFTVRDGKRRLISARPASRDERKTFQEKLNR